MVTKTFGYESLEGPGSTVKLSVTQYTGQEEKQVNKQTMRMTVAPNPVQRGHCYCDDGTASTVPSSLVAIGNYWR